MAGAAVTEATDGADRSHQPRTTSVNTQLVVIRAAKPPFFGTLAAWSDPCPWRVVLLCQNSYAGWFFIVMGAGSTVGLATCNDPKMTARNVDVFYGEKQAIFDVNIDIGKHEVIAMIGPSGCGKSTFLRCLNRMNDTIDICRVSGSLQLEDLDIYDRSLDVVELRARVGMVFQKPTPQKKCH